MKLDYQIQTICYFEKKNQSPTKYTERGGYRNSSEKGLGFLQINKSVKKNVIDHKVIALVLVKV